MDEDASDLKRCNVPPYITENPRYRHRKIIRLICGLLHYFIKLSLNIKYGLYVCSKLLVRNLELQHLNYTIYYYLYLSKTLLTSHPYCTIIKLILLLLRSLQQD